MSPVKVTPSFLPLPLGLALLTFCLESLFSGLRCIFQAPPGGVCPAAASPESVQKQVSQGLGSEQVAAGTRGH